MSAVRPGLGEDRGPLRGEKTSLLSSGVFFSAFLSSSGFLEWETPTNCSWLLTGGLSLYLSVPGPLISISLGSPSPGATTEPQPSSI